MVCWVEFAILGTLCQTMLNAMFLRRLSIPYWVMMMWSHMVENRILIADNDKLRCIFSLKRNDHISEYRKQINGLTPESRAKLNSATLIYKQLKHQTPTYLNDMFVRNINSTRSNGKLRVLVKPHSEFDKRAFGFAGINFWNSIPGEI